MTPSRQPPTLLPLLVFLAVGLVATGLILGFGRTLHDDRGYKCGSAFVESQDLGAEELYETMVGGSGVPSDCDAVRSQARTVPITLLGLGAAAGAAAAYFRLQLPAGQPRRKYPPDI